MQQVGDRATFDVLNGLRGIAAIAVVTSHLRNYLGPYFPANVGLAVDFFFVLSGFVLAHAYEDRLRGELSGPRFMAARLIRLYPLYLGALIIGGAAAAFLHHLDVPKLWATIGFNLLMLPPPMSLSSNSHDLYPLNFPAWSLLFELIANLIYALIARRLSNSLLAAIIALGFFGLIATGLTAGTLDQGVRPLQFWGGLARVTFSFFVGVALYRLWRTRPPKFGLPAALLFVLLVMPMLLKPEGSAAWIYDLAVIVLYFPLLVWLGATARAGRRWTSISVALGALSYPLYVLHIPVWNLVRAQNDWGVDRALHEASPWSGLIFTLALVALSWWVDKAFDYPLRRRLNQRLLGRSTKAGAPSRAEADGKV